LRAAGAPRRRGRPRGRTRGSSATGYSYDRAPAPRAAAHRARSATPPDQRPDDRRYAPFDRHAYRARNLVEPLINRRKQHRRVATRYGKRAGHFLAMLILAALLLWLGPG
jgi:transposase